MHAVRSWMTRREGEQEKRGVVSGPSASLEGDVNVLRYCRALVVVVSLHQPTKAAAPSVRLRATGHGCRVG